MSNQAVKNPAGDGPENVTDSYPGRRFGLPEEGPGSVSGVGRRLGALIIDWLACDVISLLVFRTHTASQFGTLGIFCAEVWLLTATTGFTLGKRLLGIRVARTDGQPVGLVFAALRTLLLILVVPPLVLDKDLRGLHDRASRTIVLRL